MLPVPGVPANSPSCPQMASVQSTPSGEATLPRPRLPRAPRPALVEEENCKDSGGLQHFRPCPSPAVACEVTLGHRH